MPCNFIKFFVFAAVVMAFISYSETKPQFKAQNWTKESNDLLLNGSYEIEQNNNNNITIIKFNNSKKIIQRLSTERVGNEIDVDQRDYSKYYEINNKTNNRVSNKIINKSNNKNNDKIINKSNNKNTILNATIKQTNHHEISIFSRNSFLDPLASFFGSDDDQRSNLFPDLNIFFQADRHTKFHLHTVIRPSDESMMMMMSIANNNNSRSSGTTKHLLHTLSNTIGAAFGVPPPESDTQHIEATRTEEVKLYDAASLRQSHFNPFHPTRILIHGWMGGSRSAVYTTLVPTYLRLAAFRHFNIFTVDWGRGALADYLTASYRVKPVGKVLAKFIDFLHREAGARFADIHLVGFSMGAHVAGIAGKFVQNGRLSVIHALDPALPFFRYDSLSERITSHDADYVEVVHTSAGSYGYDRPLGHVDFYVNYGINQPGCFLNECSHFRAFQVFAESLQQQTDRERVKDVLVGEGCEQQLWQELIRMRMCPRRTAQSLTMVGDLGERSREELKDRRGIFYVTTIKTMMTTGR